MSTVTDAQVEALREAMAVLNTMVVVGTSISQAADGPVSSYSALATQAKQAWAHLAALEAALSVPVEQEPVAVPHGWKLVPTQPTQEMVNAGLSAKGKPWCPAVYRAMLAASPAPRRTDEEVMAIANLAAAAPDMYEALAKIDSLIDTALTGPNKDDAVASMIDVVRAALSKATPLNPAGGAE